MNTQFSDYSVPDSRTKYHYDNYDGYNKIRPVCNQWTLLMKLVLMSKSHATLEKIKNILLIDPDQINLKNKHGWSALLLACRWLNIYVAPECLNILIDAAANVNDRCINRETVLMKLLQSGASIEYFILLLKSGADCNLCDAAGNTVLHHCINRGAYYPKIVNILIKYGADVNKQNFSLNTPLMLAAKIQYTPDFEKIVDLLLLANADVNKQNEEGNTALMINCEIQCNESYFIEKISKFNPNISLLNFNGDSAMHILCKRYCNNIKKLTALLELGADVNIQNSHTKITPLISTLIFDLEKSKLLINHGADVNTCDSNRIPILHHVIDKYLDNYLTNNNVASRIKLLIENRANINSMYKNETILIKLCKNKKIKCLPTDFVSYLIRLSDLHIVDDSGLTAYDYYTKYQPNDETIATLLKCTNSTKSARKI